MGGENMTTAGVSGEF